MPSIDVIERFKAQVQALSRENEIRAAQGLPPEVISPPEPLGDDLADLFGGMPVDLKADRPIEDVPEAEVVPDAEREEPMADDGMSDLFSEPVVDPAEGLPDLDDLLGPKPSEPEEPAPESGPSDEDLALSNLDDLLAEDEGGFTYETDTEAEPPQQKTQDLETSFFDEPEVPSSENDEEFSFEDASGNADFAELAGFADTKEEDVEAFDSMGEADEFQLGDFESQFGITPDDHTDSDLLNPALSLEQELEAAQKSLSLSDDEFAALQKTLGAQPLNLKLAIEELIGEKDVALEDLNKVVRLLTTGASSRSIAAAVGKILGRKISIPPGYEKGLGEALEAQRSSLWYNVRTITGPIFQGFLLATIAAVILVVLGWNFLWKPLRAQDLYDKGLVQVKLDHGEAADDLFAQAYYYWPAEDRFFQYAAAYENIGDYARAQRKYLELLRPTVQPDTDASRAELERQFQVFLTPLPGGLEGSALIEKLAEKKAAARVFYNLVLSLLATDPTQPSTNTANIQGNLIFLNPNKKGVLAYSEFETWFGDDGSDPDAHFRRANNVLAAIFSKDPNDKEALLRQGDNAMEWAKIRSSRQHFDEADRAYSLYRQNYGEDYLILWRFVRLFVQTDQESELMRFKARLLGDPNAQMDPEGAAALAQWLLDRDAARTLEKSRVVPRQRTIEEEYRISSYEKNSTTNLNPPSGSEANLPQTGNTSALGQEDSQPEKAVDLPPPHPYLYSSEPYEPQYTQNLDQIILKALAVREDVPELHYQLSRYYRLVWNAAEEKKALAAADAFFQQLEPRQRRKNGRWGIEVKTLNRIGEIFVGMNQPLQAEAYFLDARRRYEEGITQRLLSPDTGYAAVYANLGDLYYLQTPGSKNSPDSNLKGGWDQAAQLYETARAMGWNKAEVTYRLGVIRYEQKDFERAVEEFLSLESSPAEEGNWNLLYALGNTLFRTGNFALAEGYYRDLFQRLEEKRHTILVLDVQKRKAHRYLIQRIISTENNLAAAIDRGSTGLRLGRRSLAEAVHFLSTAQAMEVNFGMDLYEDRTELDVTQIDDQALQNLRAQEAEVVQKTRKEKGLISANLQLLSLTQTAPEALRPSLTQALEIFPRLPLSLGQEEAP